MALTTAVPLGLSRSFEAGTRWAAGAVLLVSTQVENLVRARAGQASCERSIGPCHDLLKLLSLAKFENGLLYHLAGHAILRV